MVKSKETRHELFICAENSGYSQIKGFRICSVSAQKQMPIAIQAVILKLTAVNLPSVSAQLPQILPRYFHTFGQQIIVKWLTVGAKIPDLLPTEGTGRPVRSGFRLFRIIPLRLLPCTAHSVPRFCFRAFSSLLRLSPFFWTLGLLLRPGSGMLASVLCSISGTRSSAPRYRFLTSHLHL